MMTFCKIITRFLRLAWCLISFFRELIMNIFFIILIIACIGYWIFLNKSNKEQNIGHKALLMNITGKIVDKPPANSNSNIINQKLFGNNENYLQENSLFDITNMIRQAKYDSNITGIVLDLRKFVSSNQSNMQYIGKFLCEFRNSGKPVIAISDNYNQSQYYLASFASKIWLFRHGTVDIHGFSTNKFYYNSLLKKLKITTHVFRIGTYKSAVESFIRDNMSSSVRRLDNYWINQVWKKYLYTIAKNRKVTLTQIFPGANNLLNLLRKTDGDKAKYALDNRLVDKLGTSDEIEKLLIKQFGWNKKRKNYRAISMYDYALKKQNEVGDSIAVIFVNGTIMNGEEISGNVGGDNIATQIRNARLDSNVKAIVLRINSPGGSVSASEVIRVQVASARKAGKPVVVSMGEIAASGGYWISTPANYIVAAPTTLTGSIGIFGIVNTIENSLDYLGVHTDGVATSPLANLSITKRLPLEALKMMNLSIENGYKRFTMLIMQSRKKTRKQIKQIAQGHIITGSDAKNKGLIDSLGDFDFAIAKAAELAKLKKWHINYYYNQKTFFDMLIDNISDSIRAILLQTIRTIFPTSLFIKDNIINFMENERNKFTEFNDPQGRYAFCLNCARTF